MSVRHFQKIDKYKLRYGAYRNWRRWSFPSSGTKWPDNFACPRSLHEYARNYQT